MDYVLVADGDGTRRAVFAEISRQLLYFLAWYDFLCLQVTRQIIEKLERTIIRAGHDGSTVQIGHVIHPLEVLSQVPHFSQILVVKDLHIASFLIACTRVSSWFIINLKKTDAVSTACNQILVILYDHHLMVLMMRPISHFWARKGSIADYSNVRSALILAWRMNLDLINASGVLVGIFLHRLVCSSRVLALVSVKPRPAFELLRT